MLVLNYIFVTLSILCFGYFGYLIGRYKMVCDTLVNDTATKVTTIVKGKTFIITKVGE